MTNATDETRQTDGKSEAPWEAWMSGRTDGASACCGVGVGEMARRSRCGALWRGHRFAIFTALTGMTLLFLLALTGSILGWIAFLRTL